ncbi:MAG: tRNA(5-methylaminomethyl-2-thiouridylate) methyltransferase [Deltaproteobacteria bacterium]|nr:tRNA(5-methylaminomethyl-2-thiouridylate) methyltransferase [Candidatus Anaeroferrophillacea bacterium]
MTDISRSIPPIFGTPIARPDIIALFSSGLDSILAAQAIQRQGLSVQAVHFITPFFDGGGREAHLCAHIRKQYGIPMVIADLTTPFLEMLADPPHGRGRHFNPCVDCKLMMLAAARAMAAAWGARGIVTGEVLGQRPFSQRRDTMRIIERDSGTEGFLLRPLSALLLPETEMEKSGFINREQLFGFSGRGRKAQMELAEQWGVTEYPTPAGGCLLTDPAFADRVRELYTGGRVPAAVEIELLKCGRFHSFMPAGFVIIGRNRSDNQRLEALADDRVRQLRLADLPGPLAAIVLTGTPAAAAAEQGDVKPGGAPGTGAGTEPTGKPAAETGPVTAHSPEAAVEITIAPLVTAAARLVMAHSRAKDRPTADLIWRQGKRHGSFTWTAATPQGVPTGGGDSNPDSSATRQSTT